MKRRTSLYVEEKLIDLAKERGINLSQLLEKSIIRELYMRNEEKNDNLGPCPVGVRGFKSPPPHDC